LNLFECVAEPARFNRSTRCIRLRVKEQHYILAVQVLEGNAFTLLIGEIEVGGFIINFHGFFVSKTPMNLYRRKTLTASFVLILITAVVAVAGAQQRRKPHKLRATGLLDLTTNQAGIVTARLTPITILDQGHFEDASIYKAAPRPMALDNGIVYEAQSSGVPVGYVTIASASNAGAWTAFGTWQPVAAAEAKNPDQRPVASANPGDDRPRLHRGSNNSTASASSSPAPTPSPAAHSTPTPAPEPEAADDPNRPVLRRRSPPATAPQPQATPAASNAPTPSPQGTLASVKPTRNNPGVHAFVAVSDAQTSDARSFQFVWKPGEQEKAEAKMRKLALAQLPRENAQLTDGSLTNVVIRSFDLDLSNDAVMVLTAEVPGAYVTPGQKNTPGKFVSRYITLIARVDFEGVPQRLAVSVTDSSRLDVAPRLELIDAVDVDGDGLAELLFREYGFDQKGFIVYGVGRGTVTKVFAGSTSALP
jgi:hypothetical protein